MMMKLSLLLLLATLRSALGFEYTLDAAGEIALTDDETGVGGIKTIFTDELILVAVDGITWNNETSGDGTAITWTTSIDGVTTSTGVFDLSFVGRELPTSIDTGSVQTGSRGTHTISVSLTLDGVTQTTSVQVEAYPGGVAIIPLLVVFCFALSTHMVEFSLYSGIFVGACIVAGNVKDGIKSSLDVYLVQAVANEDHVFVVLFTLFLSGLVGMLQKSGGMYGFTKDVALIARTPRTGQIACFLVGIFVFFDDYANVLLAGETMRPLLDLLFISREKLAFVVDATAAPIASISPISSWVGFEVGLIDTEIARIQEMFGDDLYIKTSGFAVFLQSIKYRYYPIFMLVLMMILIYSQRDFGPMLIAERRTRVYKLTDGGPGKGKASKLEGKGENLPNEGTPEATWNMVFPILLLVFFIFYLLVKSGEVEGESQSLMDKIENSNSYLALLWGTMAATICTIIFYMMQYVKNGDFVMPTPQVLKAVFFGKEKEDDEESKPRVLMNIYDSCESFLYGMGRIFPALIVLNLAWASGSIMVDVGADRLFSRWIVGGIDAEALPTLSFVISFFLALATGTSWGTMTLLFPLIMVPTYIVADGDATIFYATVAGVLSGAVAGDHVSPISDTTVLSALACDCKLLAHVGTQSPYVMITVVVSILLGTIPIGYGDKFPNIVGIFLGWLILGAFVYFVCPKIINPTGKFDVFIELWLKYKKDSPLHQIKEDTVKAFNGEEVSMEKIGDGKQLDSDSMESPEQESPPGEEDDDADVYVEETEEVA